VGAGLEPIFQRREGAVAVLSCERDRDQAVGERDVFGKQRAVEVSAEGVESAGALVAALAVITVSFDNLRERCRTGAEVGATAVVLESCLLYTF
jgi:hypothetical protein